MTDNKPMTAAQRVQRNKNRYQGAGLRKIGVWVHPDEADAVRIYAARKPLTKAIREILKK